MGYSKIILLLALIVSVIFSGFSYRNDQNINKDRINLVLSIYTDRTVAAFEGATQTNEIIGRVVELGHGEISEASFESLAVAIYDKSAHYGIGYLPDGVVTYMYPLEGNEDVIGHNVLTSDVTAKDAKLARDTKTSVFSGPYPLIQGVSGIVVRKPVYIEKSGEEEFWGFIATILNPEMILEKYARIGELEDLGYEFLIESDYNGNKIELLSSAEFDSKHAIKRNFDVRGNQWSFSLYRTGVEGENIIKNLIILLLGIAISILFYLIYDSSEKKHKRIREESYMDQLTNVYNRKILDTFGKKGCKYSNGYTLFYIDLNDFKPVNDQYGHEMGDKLLYAYAQRLKSNFRSGSTIIRMGGDEFVVIVKGNFEEEQINQFKDRLLALSKKEFIINKIEIHISASIGSASCPDDGNTFEEILGKADKQMYARKKEGKKELE